MVDGPDHKMTNRAADANMRNVFVQGASHVVDDDAELTLIGSKRVSFSPSDVVVALSVGGKMMVLYPLLPSMKRGRMVCLRTLVAPSLGQTDCRCVVVHPADLEFNRPNIDSEAKIVSSCLAPELAW
ncbi:hypothetical protein Tco_1117112, partial [Tanacetum coccineum]